MKYKQNHPQRGTEAPAPRAHTPHTGLRAGSSQYQLHVEKGLEGERDPGLSEVLLLDEKEIKEGVVPSQ